MHKKIALAALVFIIVSINWSIYQKEQHINNGQQVFIKLAPVDPRSLMQGDYMALRFDLAIQIYDKLPKKTKGSSWQRNKAKTADGFVVVALDDKKVASFVALASEQKELKANELHLQYRVRNGQVKFASNAFFFEEGTAQKYEEAKYGEFRVNDKGELLLVSMADENVVLIKE